MFVHGLIKLSRLKLGKRDSLSIVCHAQSHATQVICDFGSLKVNGIQLQSTTVEGMLYANGMMAYGTLYFGARSLPISI